MDKCTGKKLTDGMTVTSETQSCFSFADDTGCIQQGIKTVTPNPANPEVPTVVYSVDGVVIPKPENEGPCLEPGTTQPVYIMGGKLPVEVVVPATPPTCAPAITEVFGDTDVPVVFTAIAVNNPKCCEVAVATSAGAFTVTKYEEGISEHFDCNVTLESITVTGDCDPNTVHTVLTKRY